MHGALFIAPQAEEQPPSGVVVLVHGKGFDPIQAEVGDRVHYKKYSGVPKTLMLDSSPLVERCAYCLSRADDPELLPMCPKRSDALTGDPKPHEFGLGKQEPEDLLILDLRDVVLVEVQPDDVDLTPDLPPTLATDFVGVAI